MLDIEIVLVRVIIGLTFPRRSSAVDSCNQPTIACDTVLLSVYVLE